ncbi:oxidoreductase family protein [Neptunicoccus cionae]|uniref:oxidoreductase family protein n=1 Tax=Neptunicoccus cionae TaxID=2035344 RepID=UPI0011AE3B23|nr:oxidoreductase family protein [Amylibacter cionae]
MPLPIPRNAEEITPDWLSAALGWTVSDCTAQRIGHNESFTGGSLIRLELVSSALDSPATIIAKLSARRPAFRKALAEANRREVGFYTSCVTGRDLPLPRCYYADFEKTSGQSIALLEDFPKARTADFVEGCSLEDAKTVITAMARIHAGYWGATATENSWLPEFDFAQCWAAYPAQLARILPQKALPDWFCRLGDHLAVQPELFARLQGAGPQTCIHRDLQLDNVLFTPQGAVVLDWQFTGHGNGGSDLGYFLISSLTPAQRRAGERDLIRHYHQELLGQGVRSYSLQECQKSYVISVLGKMFLTVIATVLFDNSSEQKRAWRRADLERLLAFCVDYDVTPELLKTHG